MLYITPARYRTMGFGADISEVDDSQLSMQLRIASTLVNRYCNRPGNYDFRGGSVIGEKHNWNIGNEHAPIGSIGVFPLCKPLIDLDTFQIYVTNTQYLDVDPTMVNYGEGNLLMPVIAASSIGIWSYTAVPVAGFPIPEARISYSYGYRHEDLGELLYPEGEGIYRASNQWWTADPIVIYKNGTPLVENTDFTVNRDEGTIDLSQAAQDAMDFDDEITADYIHRLPEEVRDAAGVIATDLIGATYIVGAGLLGLTRIKAEEIELTQAPSGNFVGGEINDRAKNLLSAYREITWG